MLDDSFEDLSIKLKILLAQEFKPIAILRHESSLKDCPLVFLPLGSTCLNLYLVPNLSITNFELTADFP